MEADIAEMQRVAILKSMASVPNRRALLAAGISSLLLGSKGMAAVQKSFTPVPAWQPSFQQPLETVIERFRYYTDGRRDFTVFQNGTCAIVENGLSDHDATDAAIEILSSIYNYHPDMSPNRMDDGNVLVGYNHPAYNVVLMEIAQAHRVEIEARHQDGLTPDEVLITPLGPNIFDDVGKFALLGRCYMFMDAQAPNVVQINRSAS